MQFGFSFVGLIFLLMLFLPNLFWTGYKPRGYGEYIKNENRALLILERIGETSVTCLLLFFRNHDPAVLDRRICWLIAAGALMVLYEVYWVRYFKSEKTMKDFYRSLLFIPVPGASLPVAAVLLIAFFGKNPFLFGAGIILGIGHIGIHLAHKKDVEKEAFP